MYWGANTETSEILVACRNHKGVVIRKSIDFGESYEDILVVSTDYGIVKTTRTLNTPDRFVVLIKKKSTKKYKEYVYENGELTVGIELPDLKFIAKDAHRLHSTKIDTSIIYAFKVEGSNIPVIKNGEVIMANVLVRLYDKNWEEIDNVLEGRHNPGYLLPFDDRYVLSRWTTPKYYDRWLERWDNLTAASVGFDVHDIQFFNKGNGNFLMINNSDVGIRFKVVKNFSDIADPNKPFGRLDFNHYYADLHGGDAHTNGLSVASYQDQGTRLLVKLSDGRYEARKLQRSDGLEAQINQSGNAAWFRHYWQAVYYREFDEGVPGQKLNIEVDLGNTWNTPRMGLAYISGEESIYMGARPG